MDKAAKDPAQVRRVGRPPKARPAEADVPSAIPVVHKPIADDSLARAQSLAIRIWEGQSVSLDRVTRERYVSEGLASLGLSFDGVVLPE